VVAVLAAAVRVVAVLAAGLFGAVAARLVRVDTVLVGVLAAVVRFAVPAAFVAAPVVLVAPVLAVPAFAVLADGFCAVADFAAAARLAAGLVVACFAAAIVVLLLPLLAGVRGFGLCGLDTDLLDVPRSSGLRGGRPSDVLLTVTFPTFVLCVPRFVALADASEGPLGLSGRGVGTEPVS
jgi:hypothetical protein